MIDYTKFYKPKKFTIPTTIKLFGFKKKLKTDYTRFYKK